MNERSGKEDLEAAIQATLSHAFPDVEVIDLVVRGGAHAGITVFIDRPDGVDLELCATVTKALDDLRDRHALEVSSPGLDRPLRRPDHFRRAAGRRVFVETTAPIEGRSVYRGLLETAGEHTIRLALDEGNGIEIPYEAIAKANVIFDFDDNGGHSE